MTPRQRDHLLGRIALGLSLAAVVVALVVGVLAATDPRTWTWRDCANTLAAGEACALGMGLLARRSGVGQAAAVIAGVLLLGAAVVLV